MYFLYSKFIISGFDSKKFNDKKMLFFYGDIMGKDSQFVLYDVGLKYDFFFSKELLSDSKWMADKIPGFFSGYDYYYMDDWKFFLFNFSFRYMYYRFYFFFFQNIFLKNVYADEKFFFDSDIFFLNFFSVFYYYLRVNYFSNFVRLNKKSIRLSHSSKRIRFIFFKFFFKNFLKYHLLFKFSAKYKRRVLQRNLFFKRYFFFKNNIKFFKYLVWKQEAGRLIMSPWLLKRLFWNRRYSVKRYNVFRNTRFKFFLRFKTFFVQRLKGRNALRFDFIGNIKRKKKRKIKRIFLFLMKLNYLS